MANKVIILPDSDDSFNWMSDFPVKGRAKLVALANKCIGEAAGIEDTIAALKQEGFEVEDQRAEQTKV